MRLRWRRALDGHLLLFKLREVLFELVVQRLQDVLLGLALRDVLPVQELVVQLQLLVLGFQPAVLLRRLPASEPAADLNIWCRSRYGVRLGRRTYPRPSHFRDLCRSEIGTYSKE